MGVKSQFFVNHLVTISILFFICFPFQECDAVDDEVSNINPYRHFRTLDSNGKYKLEWLVDLAGKRVLFNVTAQTKGYVGFGLSKKGLMDGADIVIGGVFPNGKPYFNDKHGIRHLPPVRDKSQDWQLHSATESQTHTFLSFSRLFETCDEYDLPIHEDVIGMIWAFGERDNEIDYHYQNRGSSFAYLLDPDLTPHGVAPNQLSDPAIFNPQHVDRWLLEGSQLLPAKETTYMCSIMKAPYNTRRHMIGFNSVLPTESDRRHIHHYLFHRCIVPEGQSADEIFGPLLDVKEECYILRQPIGRIPTHLCTEAVHMWSVGQLPNFFPPHVGISMKNEYYMLQMHFDNPQLIPGIQLNYALEIFNTEILREHEASMLMIGELTPSSPSILTPPNSLNHYVYGHCGSGCTQKLFPPTGIKLFIAFLHTHLAGRGVRLIHIRDGKELPFVKYDDNYNFDYQQLRLLREEIVILPGDDLVVRCEHENADRNGNVTVGGFSTRHEMCTSVLWYYDKIENHTVCRSAIRSPEYREFLQIYNTTWSNERIEMIVQSPPQNAGLTVSEVGNYRMNWTIENRRRIQEYHRYLPHITQCPPITAPPTTPYIGDALNSRETVTTTRSQNSPQWYDFLVRASSYNQNQFGYDYEREINDPETEFVSVYPRNIIPYERPSQCAPLLNQFRTG